jgi:alpha-2-macroglobulin
MRTRLALLLLALASLAAAGSAPRIESFSPEGLPEQVQVAVRFSEPMIASGDPRPPADLFAIDCPEPGVARWTDERSWVYDLAQDLPAGVECRFTLRSEAKSLAGAHVAGRREFRFTTGGPAALESQPLPGTASPRTNASSCASTRPLSRAPSRRTRTSAWRALDAVRFVVR